MRVRALVAFLLALPGVLAIGCAEPNSGPAPARATTPAAPKSALAATPGPEPSAPAGPTPSAVTAPAPPGEPKRVAVEGRAMGTHVVLAAYTSPTLDEPTLRGKLEKGLAEIRRLEALMTTWREDSEIARVNAAAGANPVRVGAETFAVVKKAVWTSSVSEGVFDVTFEAMHGLWRFDEDLAEKVPAQGAIDKARKLIDWRQIRLAEDAEGGAGTIMLLKPGMKMSLGGIAKGYAVDVASAALLREGVPAFFAQAGGDLYVKGTKPGGQPFRVGVRDPRGKDANDFFAMLEVEDHAFSTAGDYERSFVQNGKRYHHIIDPRTGYPATATRSVTIWAKDAFTADAIDDAVFILGPEKGLKLVESIDDCGAVVVDAHNKVHVSKRLEGKVHVLRPPTDGT